MGAGFGNDYDFLPTIKEEEDLLWIWENSKDRKKFERDFEAENPESFKHLGIMFYLIILNMCLMNI